jgi:RNA polymerase sigma-70 factor (ECF subfamily)
MEVATTACWRENAAVSPEDSRAEESAFPSFVERNFRFAFRVAWALVRNRADADDIVQECFLRIARKRAWRGIRDERAYIARIVWRLAQDRRRTSPREESGMELDTITAAEHSPETAALSDAGIARIHRLIDALPEDLRQPLVLSTIDEMTSAQIAATLAIPEGTVRTRIQRARALLKQKLTPVTEARHAR